MNDLYERLGLKTNATHSDIKQAYRKKAFTCHPDKNPSADAQKQFQEVSEAYNILSDPSKRTMYDQCGYDCVRESNATPLNPLELFQSLFNVDFGGHMDTNVFFFSDLSPFGILNEIPPHTLEHTLDATLEELYVGCQKEFSIRSRDIRGGIKDTKYVLNLKPGTKDKEHLVVQGGGHYNKGTGVNDNLVVRVKETPHPQYKRQGDDLVRSHQISLCEALCGPMIRIDHLGTPLEIHIQTIVTPNSLYQVFGQGMPLKQQGAPALSETTDTVRDRGNLLLDLEIQFPDHLSDKHKGYLRQILDTERTERGKETSESDSMALEAYFYKNKQEVIKELLEDEEESSGCLQQ